MFEYPHRRFYSSKLRLAVFGFLLPLAYGVLCFAAAAAVVKFGLRHDPRFLNLDPFFAVKVAPYATEGYVPDIVFLGTSRIYRHIDTELVQSRLSACSAEDVEVYNFGIPGASASNLVFLSSWIAGRETFPDQLWIEPFPVRQYETVGSTRSLMYSPVWPEPIWREEFFPDSRIDDAEELRRRVHLATLSLSAFANTGAWHRLLESEPPDFPRHFGDFGYNPHEEPRTANYPSGRARLRALEANPDVFAERVAHAAEVASQDLDRQRSRLARRAAIFLDQFTDEQLDHVGIIVPPAVNEFVTPFGSIPYRGRDIPVLTIPAERAADFADPEDWADLGHFTRSGARKYSEILSDVICQRRASE
jgi:hypothetical protein